MRDAALTVPLDLIKRLVGAAAGVAPDHAAVEEARAEPRFAGGHPGNSRSELPRRM